MKMGSVGVTTRRATPTLHPSAARGAPGRLGEASMDDPARPPSVSSRKAPIANPYFNTLGICASLVGTTPDGHGCRRAGACRASRPCGGDPVELDCRITPQHRTKVLLSQAKSVRALDRNSGRSEEHTSELQSPCNLVCRLLLEK